MNYFVRLSWIVVLLLFVAQTPRTGAEPATAKPATVDAGRKPDLGKDVTQGTLRVVGKEGEVVECPLKHTNVKADVSGFITRVQVTQTFTNPSKERIEAVYVFPLPHEAAVDAMTMNVGDRRIVGLIKRRVEARQIYEQALMSGNTAALLEQERPNIFTQSVGNIEPGQEVRIEISYVDVLRYDMGTYEFHFQMVVGPLYNPGSAISSPQDTPPNLQGKVSPPVVNTDRVPDAQRISPPVLMPSVRNGHDISLTMTVDAGIPIQNLTVANHRAEVTRDGDRKAKLVLAKDDSLPNKDFVVRYSVVGKEPAMALLAHTGNYSGDAKALGNGYFMLMIQPRDDERLRKSPPRELVFLVDVSGSMSGAPTAKVVETMQHMLKLCREQDTVQVITFASHAEKLFERPVPVNEQNIGLALNFTAGLKGSGGTEMLKGVKLAIDEPIDAKRLRIVVMLTDGYIGNEAEIIEHVGKNCGDHVRFWCVGIGQSPNMFLVDGVAKQGGGMGKQLGLNDDSAALSQEIITRIQRAQLANVKIDWGTNRVAETYPTKIPELWAGRPIIVFGRFRDGGQPGTIRVNGTIEGEPASWPLEVNLPANEAAHNVLASVWARRKVEGLMQHVFYQNEPSVEEEVTAVALDYRLMSQYTSFVAVDEKDATKAAPAATPPRRMLVPVPLPEGTRWEGFFGEGGDRDTDRLDALGVNFGRGRALEEGKESAPASRLSVESLRVKVSNPRGYAASRRVTQLADGLQRDSRFGAFYRNAGPTSSIATAMPGMPGGGMMPGRGMMPGMPGGLGRGGAFGGRTESFSLSKKERAEVRLSVLADGEAPGEIADFDSPIAPALAFTVMQAQSKALLDAAREALKMGREKQTQQDLESARQLFTSAYFQATAATYGGLHDEGIAASAITALEEVRAAQVRVWAKKQPALDKRLDLVIRDQSLADAIAAVAKAAGVPLVVVPGSIEDSAALLERPARVNFLDLRHATLAEAMDWLCLPARMTWRPSKAGSSLAIGTERRLDGVSTWIYDVSSIAFPTTEELSKLADDAQKQAAVNKAAEEFLALFRGNGRTAANVAWYTPGELLIVGSVKEHADVAKLLTDLTGPTAKLNGPAAALYAATSKRAQQSKENRAKRLAAIASLDVAEAHNQFGWRLLSEALAGRLDDEAITELRIAWSRPETENMLKDQRAVLVLRNAWLIQEAARLVRGNKELDKLSAAVRQKSRSASEAALANLEANWSTPSAMPLAIYGCLAQRGDATLVDKFAGIFHRVSKDTAHPIAQLAMAILQPDSKESRQTLTEWCAKEVQGTDTVVLLAMACRQAGDETWTEFRTRSSELLGGQPLPGDVVVLVNRLSQMRSDKLASAAE